VYGDQRECAGEPAAHLPHRLGEIAPRGRERVLQQVSHHLGVGIRPQLVPGPGKLGSQCGEVLDDPVVDDRDSAAAVGVWMRVAIGGGTMRRPASVPHARRTPEQGATAVRRLACGGH
jgi:hypothetical protein